MYYFLFITLKNILSLVFFLKALKDILQHFKSVNSWFRFFDVTNRLQEENCNILGATLCNFCPSCFHTRTQSELKLAQTKKCGKMPSIYGGPSLRMQIRDESRDAVKKINNNNKPKI